MGVEKSVMYFFLFVEVADLHVCYILYRGSNLTAFPLHFKREAPKIDAYSAYLMTTWLILSPDVF